MREINYLNIRNRDPPLGVGRSCADLFFLSPEPDYLPRRGLGVEELPDSKERMAYGRACLIIPPIKRIGVLVTNRSLLCRHMLQLPPPLSLPFLAFPQCGQCLV